MQIRYFVITNGIALLLSILFLSGCADKQPQRTQSAMIVWKSPSFRYADMGFISDSGKRLQVEIYGSGSALMRLKIDGNSICMSRFSCMTKESFNRELLSAYYPGDTLENIFRGKPLYGGVSLAKKRNGFTQNIQKPNRYNIVYTVLNNQIIFRDTINQIIIKVTKQ
ncbi:MAG: hypothetical protein U9R26_03185 [Campylobacterota bacterium]|nr:hypothetical protein [Campylobacterota bacterium]